MSYKPAGRSSKLVNPDRPTRRLRRMAGFALAAGWLLPPSHAGRAAGFQVRENDARGMGSAFADSAAMSDDPATAYANPAGMTLLDATQFSGGGTIVLPSARFSGTSVNALGAPNTGTAARDGGDRAYVPYAYLVHSLTRDLKLGLAVTGPFGLSTDYGPNWIGRYNAETSLLQSIDINASAAYRLTPWLSVGAGVSANYANADLSGAINSTIVALSTSGVLSPLPDGDLTVKGHGWGIGYDVGVLLQPAGGTRVGLAYHSRIDQTITGSALFTVPFPLSAAPAFSNSPAKASITLPDTGAISLVQALTPRWSLLCGATWTNWSRFRDLTIRSPAGTLNATPERWHDSYSVALGDTYQWSRRLTLRSGIAYDESPVPAAYRTARIPDQDRIWLSIGASVAVAANVTLDASYAHLFLAKAVVGEISPAGDVLAGSYNSHIDLIALGARARF